MITLKEAVKDSIVLRIKYYPNKDGQERRGWRTVLPLDLYTYRGQYYCLCWFVEGSSVSGGDGYRLFLVRNIQDIKETDTTKQQPFAMSQFPIWAFDKKQKSKCNFQVVAWQMVKLGKVE